MNLENKIDCSAAAEASFELFGVRIENITMRRALEQIAVAVAAPGRVPVFAAFVNADCMNIAYRRADYAGVLRAADHVWADGVGVAIAAGMRGVVSAGNVNGTDMLPELCCDGHRLYLYGGAPGVAEQARIELEKKYPKLVIAGVDHGFEPDSGRVIERINASGADVLLVAMGAPKQELWIFDNLERLRVRFAVGVGGLFDFASGRIPRAPLWLRRLKLEWVYRLYQEPVRLFRRYIIGNPLFLFRVLFFPDHRA
ncbi:MAG: WecB/TagA/CpsF family glycosyltransferase [Victivallaceae bacterium]|nr:WecB/TagA/CpsF family glycosyltransferase [Victivallaceae bacterium]